MSKPPFEIPDDLESLRELALRQQAQIDEKASLVDALSEELRTLREYIQLLKHQRFAAKSEKGSDDQLRMFDEAEQALAREGVQEEETDVEVGAHTRKKRGRRPLPEWIPRLEVLHDLADDDKVCPADGTALERMGEEVCEQLEFVPAKLRVLRHVRPKYACPQCRTGIQVAPMPPQPIPKSMASPTLLAHVAVSKYADALPLYRQEQMFGRLGIDLPRATFASWMVKVGELVQPLINLLREDLLASGFVQCDETRFQVLQEPGKAATSQSYLWAQRGGAVCPISLFDYDPSRSAEVPKRLFEGFEGILQTDGYEGYGWVGGQPGIVHAGCWVHTRRKFDEALKAQGTGAKKKHTTKTSVARQGLVFIQKLYKIEKQIGDATAEERHRIRQQRSKPVIESMREWIDASIPRVPPQSLTGKALAYTDSQWPKLIRVLDDGRIPLDTNGVENAIRPFVVGRKNWLFANTVQGAQASANLYSVIETAKAFGIEPFAYLRLVFAELPRATTLDEVQALLPSHLDRDRLHDPRHLTGHG